MYILRKLIDQTLLFTPEPDTYGHSTLGDRAFGTGSWATKNNTPGNFCGNAILNMVICLWMKPTIGRRGYFEN
jgi:hypothetical protein